MPDCNSDSLWSLVTAAADAGDSQFARLRDEVTSVVHRHPEFRGIDEDDLHDDSLVTRIVEHQGRDATMLRADAMAAMEDAEWRSASKV